MPQVIEKKQYWYALLIYTGFVFVYFYPVLYGQLIGQTDFLYFLAPWVDLRPADLTTISNSMLQDQSAEFLPFFLEAKSQMANGLFPLWNPYIFAGTPLWANTQSALLFPLNFGHYLFPAPIGFTISSLLKIILTGFFTYIFARKIKLSHFAALISGIVFSYAMFNIFWLNHPHTNATMLLPLSLYFAEHLLQNYKNRVKKIVLQFALLIMVSLFSGHVEITFIIAVATGLYFFIRALQLKILSLRLILLLFSAYLLACLLAAIVIIPFVEFLIHSATWDVRGEHKLSAVSWDNFSTLFFGKIFVGEAWQNGKNLGHSLNLYIGIISLPLIFIAMRYAFKKSLVFIILSIISLLTFFNIASIHSFFVLIPILKQTPLYYFVILWLISGSIMVGIGIDKCQQLNWKIEPLTILTLFVVLLATIIVIKFQGHDYAKYITDYHKLDLAKFYALSQVVALLFSALLVYIVLTKYKKFGQVALLLLFFSDMWLIGHDWNPTIKKEHAFIPKNDVISQFFADKKEPFRVFSLNNILRPSSNMLINIEDLQGYDVPVSKRFHNFFNQVLQGKDRFWRYNILHYNEDILPYLEILNTTHILSRMKLKTDKLHLEMVGEKTGKKAGAIKFYALENPKKRAFMMYKTLNAKTPEQALQMVIDNKNVIKDVVILENNRENDNNESQQKIDVENSIEFYSRNSQKIKFKVSTQEAGWLVLSQSYYPGWQAYIDGKKVEIYPADYLLQAIKMPKGQHQVCFVYRPWSFYIGLIISLFSFGLVVWQLKKRKK